MNKDYILNKAQKLSNVSKETLEELQKLEGILLSEINNRMLDRDDLSDMIGNKNTEMMKDNHANHLKFMKSMFLEFQAVTFVNTIIWVFRAYRSRGFKTTYWSSQLNTWLDIFQDKLSDKAFNDIFPFYEFIIVHIPEFVALSEHDNDTTYPEH